MRLEKKWFFKRGKHIGDNNFEIILFFKGSTDKKIQVDLDLLSAALGVSDGVLRQTASADLITQFFKTPNLISDEKSLVNNNRLLLGAMETLLLKQDETEIKIPTLSFENIDYCLGKSEGFAKTVIGNR